MSETMTQSTLTAEQQELRKTGIGASEIAAVAGLDRYRTPLDVWLRKRGFLDESFDNQFMEWGRRLEPLIVQAYVDALGVGDPFVRVTSPGTRVHPTESWMLATPDRYIELVGQAPAYGLECKSRNARNATAWGESGTDLIPEEVAAQCHWSMRVTGMHRWDVAVLIGGNDFRTYTLHADKDIGDTLQEIGYAFWHTNVLGGVEPALEGSSAKEYLAKKFRTHDAEIVEATDEQRAIITELIAYRQDRDRLDAVIARQELKLKAIIGSHAGMRSASGTITWKATKDRATTDWKAIVAALPNDLTHPLIDEYTTTTPGTRRFLVTPAKENT